MQRDGVTKYDHGRFGEPCSQGLLEDSSSMLAVGAHADHGLGPLECILGETRLLRVQHWCACVARPAANTIIRLHVMLRSSYISLN